MSKFKQSFHSNRHRFGVGRRNKLRVDRPTANPPLNNAPAPINVSVLGQIKSGAAGQWV